MFPSLLRYKKKYVISIKFIYYICSRGCAFVLPASKKDAMVGASFNKLHLLSCCRDKVLSIFLFSTIITYLCGLAIEHEVNQDKKKAKRYLIIGLILNFGMQILLPLGISFYTFQTSGYLLDIYWKRDHAEKNIFRYALFVSYFPQILQGPIGRHSRLAEQLYEGHSFDLQRICRGIQRIFWGFFKKMILADWSAVFVDAIFGNPDQYNGLAIFGVLFYSMR